MKKQSLSDKRFREWGADDYNYPEEDVRQFIKRIEKRVWDIMGSDMDKREAILMYIESEAGDKLI